MLTMACSILLSMAPWLVPEALKKKKRKLLNLNQTIVFPPVITAKSFEKDNTRDAIKTISTDDVSKTRKFSETRYVSFPPDDKEIFLGDFASRFREQCPWIPRKNMP